MTKSSKSDLSFHVPPECQGQIVEVAYAVDAEREEIVCRSFDASARTESLAVTPLDNLVGELCNRGARVGFPGQVAKKEVARR